MEYLITLINTHIVYAPVIIALALCVSGFGLPISEDVLVILAGVLASQNPDMAVVLYLSIVIGAYSGDSVTYWLGRLGGNRLLETKLFKNQIDHKKLDKLSVLFSQRAARVIIGGRFIPFGMRIMIYLVAGIGKFDYRKFAILDMIAVSLTTSITFSLAYYFGNEIISVLDKVKYVILIVLVAYGLFSLFKSKKSKV